MSATAIFLPVVTSGPYNRSSIQFSSCLKKRRRLDGYEVRFRLLRPQSFRVRSTSQQGDTENGESTYYNNISDSVDKISDEDEKIAAEQSSDTANNNNNNSNNTTFMAKIAIAIGTAATITLISVGVKRLLLESSIGFQLIPETSYSSAMSIENLGFSFKAFGYRIILPEYAPGWIYFWLLMAAGFGLFISEEALNIWVGISLARMLTFDGTWRSFAESFSRNSGYIVSTILWVYWGVCISDMIPFYLGKLFRQSGASDDICSKLGVGKEKALSITSTVQKYGNLIGFVERFSLGVRNPTSFLAGASGISPEFYFAGVCFGGLITLPIQLVVGFFMRERPLFALASVATVVGIWTIFPYAVAALTALFLIVRRRRIL